MRLFVTRRSLAKQIQGGLAEDGIPVLAVGIAEQPRLGERTSAHDAVLLDGSLCESLNYAALLRWWRTRLNAYLLALLPRDSSGAECADCLNAGADVCLTEPLCVNELRAHLRALRRYDRLAGERANAAGQFLSPVRRVYDLEINTEARRVQRAGLPIRLTRREFELLQLLAVHEGEVVSRPAIRKHLYSDRDENSSNVVAVYVHHLREKIDKGFKTPLVQTCWGQGYRLRAANG